jgi:serine phosphatase RsbU (regulator of sigma subunit)/pSer/pThr/pTyr-binding forkhead associated (FHA) protein
VQETLRLRVEPPEAEAFRHECRPGSVVVGRSSEADLKVRDRFMSRRHARLYREADGWYLEDLGSRNPTLLNGQVVTQPTRVAPGDVLRLAHTTLYVEGPEETGALSSANTVMLPVAGLMDPATGSPRDVGGDRLAARLRMLNELHRALAASISLDDLLERVLDRAFAALQPEEGAIFIGGSADELRLASSRRQPGLTGEFLCSRQLMREVTEKGVAALVPDAVSDARFAASESIHTAGVRSILAAPLLDAAGCLGMIALNSRTQVRRFSEADIELLAAIASAAALRIRNLGLAEDAALKRLLDKELAVAHDIQMGMLPRRFPEQGGVELFAELHPARRTGGDLYDFHLDGERLWFVVGDVAGKGLGAALTMTVTLTLFRAFARLNARLPEVVERMNRELARENERATFVTAFLGCLDVASGELELANAGHNPPYRLFPGGGVEAVTAARGLALGVREDYAYASERLFLGAGESLFVYTDGVTEALSPSRQEFSQARLESFLGGVTGASPAEIVRGCLAAVRAFASGAPQSDDIALLALRRRPPSS